MENGGCRLYKCVYACVCSGGQGGGFSVYVSARTHGNHVLCMSFKRERGWVSGGYDESAHALVRQLAARRERCKVGQYLVLRLLICTS